MTSRRDIVLGTADFTVILALMAISVSIGLYFKYSDKKRCKMSETLFSEIDVPVILVAVSIAASVFNSKEIIHFGGLSYYNGLKMLYAVIGASMALPICIFMYGAVLYESKTSSVYEYLEKRFGIKARRVGTLQFIVLSILYASDAMNSASAFFFSLTGTSSFVSVIFTVLICQFYCFIGGIKAVIWSNAIQILVMFASIILLISKGIADTGGLGKIWQISAKEGLTENVSFAISFTSGRTFYEEFVGSIIFIVYYFGLYQPMFQLAMCCKSPKQRKIAVAIGWMLHLLMFILAVILGIVMRVSLVKCFGNVYSFDLEAEQQIVPRFAKKHLKETISLLGVLVAGIFGGTLSAISIIVLSMATTTFQDILRPLFSAEDLSHSKVTFMTKILTILYGAMFICGAMAFAIVTQFVLISKLIIKGIAATQIGIFTLGMVFKRSNEKGALTAFAVSQIFSLWISIGKALKPISPKPFCNPFRTTTFTGFQPSNNYALFNHSDSDRSEKDEVFKEYPFFNVSIKKLFPATIAEEYTFPLYLMSDSVYMLTILTLTMIVGYTVSWLTDSKVSVSRELLYSVPWNKGIRIETEHQETEGNEQVDTHRKKEDM